MRAQFGIMRRILVFYLFCVTEVVIATRTRSGGDYGSPDRRSNRSGGSRYAPYTRSASPTRRHTSQDRTHRRTVAYPSPETIRSVVAVSVVTSTSIIVVTCPPLTTRPRYNGHPSNPIVTAAGGQQGGRVHLQPTPASTWGQSSVRPVQANSRQPGRPHLMSGNSANGSRWDSRTQNFPVVHRPPPPPPSLQPHQGAIFNPVFSRPLPGLPANQILTSVDTTVPLPPEWQPYLRDLVISLGYRRAVSVWPRLARCRLGNYSEATRREQDSYMIWCRETILGFER